MRIVQLANFYAPASGGLRTSLEEIGRGYVDSGHERIVIVPGLADGDEVTPSGRRVSFASPRLPGAGGYRVLTSVRRVLRTLDALGPDVLEVSDKLSIAWLLRWARRRNVPIVLFSHERIDAILATRVPRWVPLPAVADLANRRLSRLVDTVIVASAFSAEEFLRVGANNVRRIPLGVDLDVFRPVPRGPDPNGRPVTLVTLSRLSSEKRPDLTIECLRALRESGVDAQLVLIGDGPLRSELEQQADGLPVEFTGHITSRPAVAALLAAADVAIFPSAVETFGLAILEALACGTPVVVPAAGAAPELVRPDGSGIACAATAEGLAAGVRELLAVPAEQRRRAARRAAEDYPWSATVDQLLDSHTATQVSPRSRYLRRVSG